MASAIKKNLVYLTEKLANLEKLILYFIQEGVFSKDERERILSGQTTLDKNTKFWDLLERKDWEFNRSKFLKILRQTKNVHCADKIEGLSRFEEVDSETEKIILVLENKWWPEEKFLPKSFLERKSDKTTLVEDLFKKLSENQTGSTVICQGTAVSGLGGVGKTTTAKWFAQHYQHLYDHIIWIDCGEGSLITSFTDLANELNINPNLRLNLLAKKCFSEFQGFKCLCIFDNAESYQGHQGIRQVLPKIKNIHTIITSRTRDWGSESGDGKICELQLNAFDTNDGVTFLENNLKDSNLYTEDQLKEFCELLGNLPLALQIAVTTINGKKISLDDYCTRIKTTHHILNQNFDDYEKTINKTMKISLDLIKNHESDSKQLAYNILLIFGYIKPDFVDLDFFQEIEKASKYEIQEAVELLEKYSLITVRSGSYAEIHRLLQQVIRHNSRDDENSILRKILSSDSPTTKNFVYYKLIPYSFANEQLQNEFPQLQAELIDQMKLKKLMQERLFTEAGKLSKIIKNTLNSFNAKYNHAFCLITNSDYQNALHILETLYDSLHDDPEFQIYDADEENASAISSLSFRIDEMGLLDLRAEIKFELVIGLLFAAYAKSENFEKANKLMTDENLLLIHNDVHFVDNLLRFLQKSSSIANFELNNNKQLIIVKLDHAVVGKKIKLNSCSFGDYIPDDLTELGLSNVDILAENGDPLKQHDISKSISANLTSLTLRGTSNSTRFMFELNIENTMSLSNVDLEECTIIVTANHGSISPLGLTMQGVSFIRDGIKLRSVNINEFFDFKSTTRFELNCSSKEDIYFDPCCLMSIRTVFLYQIKQLPLQELNWNINDLTLMSVDIPLISNPTRMKLNHLHLRYSTISLSSLVHLSHDVKKITLFIVTLTNDSGNFPPEEQNMLIEADEVSITDLEYIRGNNTAGLSVYSVNDFLRLEKMKELSLKSEKDEEESNMTLDFNDSFIMEDIYLEKVKPLNLENSRCNITKFSIRNVDISFAKKTTVRVNTLCLIDSVVDWKFLTDVSRSTETLDIHRTKITSWEGNSLTKKGTEVSFQENFKGAELNLYQTVFVTPRGDEMEDVLINQLIKLGRLKKLHLSCSKDAKNLTLNMKDPFQLNDLYLNHVNVENLYASVWDIERAFLYGTPLARKLRLQIKDLTFGESSIDLPSLPGTIQRIRLEESSTIICNQTVNLPDLIYMSLPCHFYDKVENYLSGCPRLTRIEFRMTSNVNISKTGIYNLDVDSLPKAIRRIKFVQPNSPTFGKFSSIVLSGETVLELEKLVLDNFRFQQLHGILSKLKPEILVFKKYYNGIRFRHMNSVLELLEKPMKKLVIGRVHWHWEKAALQSPLVNFVDKLDMSYLFEKRKGISIVEVEFDKYAEL